MRKFALLLFSASLALWGCANTAGSESPEMQTENTAELELPETQTRNTPDAQTSEVEDISIEVVQGGPYGEISLSLPTGWTYETCPTDSGKLMNGMYGIRFSPDDVTEGYIELVYMDRFGVCGTGLTEEQVTIAGNPANIGTYDGHEYWDFIFFREENEGLIVFTYSVSDWWSEYADQVLDILDTLSFRRDVREGGANIYSEESRISEIALSFSLKNISSTGATLVFNQYDADALTGELVYGEDFVIEMQNNGKWENAPIIVEGDYGFNEPAYMISPEDTVETKLSWEWLYGELAPGEYRIGKSILDYNNNYMIYAHFILN